jgi:hypothetical protein
MEEIQREESEKEQTLHAIAKVAALQEQERREAEAALAAVAQFEQKQHRGNPNAKQRNGGRRSKSNAKSQQGKKQAKGGKGIGGGGAAQMLVGMVPIQPGTVVSGGKRRSR